MNTSTSEPERQLAPSMGPGTLGHDLAAEYKVEPKMLMAVLAKAVIATRREDPPPSNEELFLFMSVCDKYRLNPMVKEIHAFRSKGKLQVVVGVDGWYSLVNRRSVLDGIEFTNEIDDKGAPISCTCTIHRKDRAKPTVVTEYFRECKRNTEPWSSHPFRMLRHKAFIQCARAAFSLSGIMDEDDAIEMGLPVEVSQQISDARTIEVGEGVTRESALSTADTTASIKERLKKTKAKNGDNPTPESPAETKEGGSKASVTPVTPAEPVVADPDSPPESGASDHGGLAKECERLVLDSLTVKQYRSVFERLNVGVELRDLASLPAKELVELHDALVAEAKKT